MVRPNAPVTAVLGIAVLALASVVAGCQIRPEAEPLGQPVADAEGVAGVASVGWAVSELASLDFDNAVYASACGLSWIDVGSGVGEGPSLGGIYGLEVVDVVIGELDDEPGEEAAVLVDCLGGDTYSPHVLGFDADGLNSTEGGPVVLLPSTGGSLPVGQRPVSIDLAGDALRVQLSGPDGDVEHTLRWASHVMSGGELAAVPGSVVHGVIIYAEPAGTLVVSLAPGVGYRLSTPEGFTAIDPDTGAELTAAEMSGRAAKLSLDSAGAVGSVELLPGGAA